MFHKKRDDLNPIGLYPKDLNRNEQVQLWAAYANVCETRWLGWLLCGIAVFALLLVTGKAVYDANRYEEKLALDRLRITEALHDKKVANHHTLQMLDLLREQESELKK